MDIFNVETNFMFWFALIVVGACIIAYYIMNKKNKK